MSGNETGNGTAIKSASEAAEANRRALAEILQDRKKVRVAGREVVVRRPGQEHVSKLHSASADADNADVIVDMISACVEGMDSREDCLALVSAAGLSADSELMKTVFEFCGFDSAAFDRVVKTAESSVAQQDFKSPGSSAS